MLTVIARICMSAHIWACECVQIWAKSTAASVVCRQQLLMPLRCCAVQLPRIFIKLFFISFFICLALQLWPLELHAAPESSKLQVSKRKLFLFCCTLSQISLLLLIFCCTILLLCVLWLLLIFCYTPFLLSLLLFLCCCTLLILFVLLLLLHALMVALFALTIATYIVLYSFVCQFLLFPCCC